MTKCVICKKEIKNKTAFLNCQEVCQRCWIKNHHKSNAKVSDFYRKWTNGTR